MDLSDKTEKRTLGKEPPREVTVVIEPLTKEEAREMYPSRPHSKYAESRWGGNTMVDDVALVLNGMAKGCGMCRATTRTEYLRNDTCPDCDGRSEYEGANPRAQ